MTIPELRNHLSELGYISNPTVTEVDNIYGDIITVNRIDAHCKEKSDGFLQYYKIELTIEQEIAGSECWFLKAFIQTDGGYHRSYHKEIDGHLYCKDINAFVKKAEKILEGAA